MPTISVVAILCFFPIFVGFLIWEYMQFTWTKGLMLIGREEAEAAAPYFEKTIKLAHLFRDKQREGDARNNAGVCYLKMRQFSDAVAVLRPAISLLSAVPASLALANAWDNTAVAFRLTRQFDQAVSAHQSALVVARQIHDQTKEVAVLSNLSITLKEAGKFDEALKAGRQALAAAEAEGGDSRKALALSNLSLVSRESGQMKEAINYAARAAELFALVGDRRGECAARENLGLALAEQGQKAEAAVEFQNALRLLSPNTEDSTATKLRKMIDELKSEDGSQR